MNKVILKEFERKYLIVDILFYSVFVVLGFLLLNCSDVGIEDPIQYGPYLFYLLAFFSLLAYFVNRRKDDYELLLFGFINVVTATFILIYTNYPDSGFIMGDAVLLYSIANVLNKGFSCSKLLDKKDFNFFPKVSVTILLLFLGVFVVASLYSKVNVGIMILGYYFIIYGLLSLLEPFNEVLLRNEKFDKYLLNLLSYERDSAKVEVKNEKEEETVEAVEEVKKPVVRKVVTKKPVVKKTTVAKKPTKKTATKKATTKKTATKKTATTKTKKTK